MICVLYNCRRVLEGEHVNKYHFAILLEILVNEIAFERTRRENAEREIKEFRDKLKQMDGFERKN